MFLYCAEVDVLIGGVSKGINAARSMVLLLGVLIAASCSFPGVSRDPLVADFPGEGWRMFATPRDFDNAGTVFGITEKGAKGVIANPVLAPQTRAETLAETADIRNRSVGIGALIGFIEGNSAAGSVRSRQAQGAVRVSLKLENAERRILVDEARTPLVEVLRKSAGEIARYRSYHLIREVVSASAIAYKFDPEEIRRLGLDAEMATIAKKQSGYHWDGAREYRLEQTFAKPMNIFFLETSYDAQQLVEIRRREVADKEAALNIGSIYGGSEKTTEKRVGILNIGDITERAMVDASNTICDDINVHGPVDKSSVAYFVTTSGGHMRFMEKLDDHAKVLVTSYSVLFNKKIDNHADIVVRAPDGFVSFNDEINNYATAAVDSRDVVFLRQIDNHANIRIYAPDGTVEFQGNINGGASVDVNAREVKFSGVIDGGSAVSITAQNVEFNRIRGNSGVAVTLKRRGKLSYQDLSSGGHLDLYKEAAAPLPIIRRGSGDGRLVVHW